MLSFLPAARVEWGFPKTQLWKEHSANLAKEQLREVWVKQLVETHCSNTADHDHKDGLQSDEIASADAASEGAAQQPSVVVDLADIDAVRDTPLVKVAEAFGIAMTTKYLSALLPTDGCFDSPAKRMRWVESAVKAEGGVSEAVQQVLFYQLGSQHRKWMLEAQQRELSKARAREKKQKIDEWLQTQYQNPSTAVAVPPEGVSVTDIALELVKQKVKDELQEVVVDELGNAWEIVKQDAQERVQSFWNKHWILISGVSVAAVVVPMSLFVKIMRM